MATGDDVATISYEPLGPGEIRVIDLPKFDEADEWVSHGYIWGHLRVARLDDEPRYAALSYAWGKEEKPPQHWFMCGPSRCSSPWTQVPITANCWSALRNLPRMHGKMTIWVDAICIDQHNEVEKLDQIPRMGRVYS